MQVEVTKSEGLTREFAVTVPASENDGKDDARHAELALTIKMPGFRPGKVPVSLVKKQHGRNSSVQTVFVQTADLPTVIKILDLHLQRC